MGDYQRKSCLSYRTPVAQAPCAAACPAGIDVPRYVRYIAEGKFGEALAVVRERNPFPSVCGHACFAPCEAKCNAGLVAEPVSIRALKRFVAEQCVPDREPPPGRLTGRSVAVIGSGPAGLTAAYYLAKRGHTVTVFEASSEAGGMLSASIPPFILPRDVLKRELDNILSVGVELKLNSPVASLDSLSREEFNAIFIATGLPKGRKLPVTGADLDGVLVGLDFLRDIAMRRATRLGKKVVVVGGGGVALDVARSARRLAAREVHIVCIESKKSMPTLPSAVEEAEKEGVVIHPSCTCNRILGNNGRVSGVECTDLRWAKFDSEGGLHTEAIKGSEHILEADTVIFAIGQSGDMSLIADAREVAITRRGTLAVDPATLQTSMKGVFAGGDIVSGPASIIEAIAAGRQAAISIDKYLGGKGLIESPSAQEAVPLAGFEPVGERNQPPSLPVTERLATFNEVELGFNKEMAIREARRCLRCDLPIAVDMSKCAGCRTCQLRCSFRWEGAFIPARGRVTIQRLVGKDHEFDVSFSDKCDYCGICARYCPYGALTRGKIEEA